MRCQAHSIKLALFLAMLVLAVTFHLLVSENIEYVTSSNTHFSVQDYAYHIILTKSFWFEGFGNIYSLPFQQKALSSYVGSEIHTVMPIGVTPLSLIVWFPFAWAAGSSMALAYTLWTAFSLAVLFAALWKPGRAHLLKMDESAFPLALFLVTIFSAATFRTLFLGQTSLLAAGLFIFLVRTVRGSLNHGGPRRLLLVPFLVSLLAVKPVYLSLALALLISYGLWRVAIYSATLTAAVSLGLTPLLGIEWISTYADVLHMYDRGGFPQEYAWAIDPETMNIFRSAAAPYMSDVMSGLISHIVIGAAYAIVVGVSISYAAGYQPAVQGPLPRVSRDLLFPLLVSIHLLFAPYSGAYEDLLILPVITVLLLSGHAPKLASIKGFASVAALLIVLLHSYYPLEKGHLVFWTVKAGVLGYMASLCRFPRTERERHLELQE